MIKYLFWIVLIILFIAITFVFIYKYVIFKFLNFNYVTSNNSIKDYGFNSKHIIELYGKYKIKSITIVKSQLSLYILFCCALLELPDFNPINLYNFSTKMHTSIIFTLTSDKIEKQIMVEKHAGICLRDSYTINSLDKIITININKPNLTFAKVLSRSKRDMGDTVFFNWQDPFKENCQTITVSLLKHMGINSKEIIDFVVDDIDINCWDNKTKFAAIEFANIFSNILNYLKVVI